MKYFFRKLLYFFCYIIFRSPRFIQLGIAEVIGVLWFDILRIRRKVAIDNIAQSFPDWPREKVVRVARASLVNMGITIVDFAILACISKEEMNKKVIFKGREHLQKALSENKGAFLLGSHLANGDFGIAGLSNSGLPMHLISKRFSSLWLDEIWFGIRGRFGTKFIAPRNSSYEILKAAKANEIVIFVLDQFMGPPLGVKTTFFGRPTGTAMGLALFVERTKTPVLPCYAHRLEDGRYEVCFEEPVPFEDQGDKNLNLKCMTQKYTDKIEEIVRQYPEQWMWIHRRWKPFHD